MSEKQKTLIKVLLLVLVALDLIYSVIAFLFPEFWFKTIHGAPYIDPEGLLRRTGAVWVAFTLFQFIAYFKWQEHPYWLAIVAGLRFSELIADWTYLYFAQDITSSGRLGLLLSTPANLVICWFLLRSFLKLEEIREK